MATYDQGNLATGVNIDFTNPNLVTPASYITSTATEWSWNTGGALNVTVVVKGTGFTYSGNDATSGTVSSVDFYYGGVVAGNGDFRLAGLTSVDITKLNLGPAQFWNQVLNGDDYFNLDYNSSPGGQVGVVFGDDFASATTTQIAAVSQTDQGGDDFFIGGQLHRTTIGDVYTVAGSAGLFFNNWAVYQGGNDTILSAQTIYNYRAIGDAWIVGSFGVLNGGNDTINGSNSTGGGSMVVGDAYQQTGGIVNGGDDILIGNASNVNSATGFGITGDVYDFDGGTVNGGDDVIQAITFGGLITGDVDSARGTGTINGGDDTIYGSIGNDDIYGDVGDTFGAMLTITNGDDTIFGGHGVDTIFGDSDGDLGIGGNDRLYGQSGNDFLYGQKGNDYLDGGTGDDRLEGGEGNDELHGGKGVDRLFGQAGDDKLFGDDGDDILDGGDNNDTIEGGAGNDSLTGGSGNDTIDGGAGDDQMYGGTGIDTLSYASAISGVDVTLNLVGSFDTGAGIDLNSEFENLTGSAFGDKLKGDAGNNIISGGDGADEIIGGTGGVDFLQAGNGFDSVNYSALGSSVSINLISGKGTSTAFNGTDILSGFEVYFATAFDDTFLGDSGNSRVYGGAGNDNLVGGDGTDDLYGGIGNDLLDGGAGIDAAAYSDAASAVAVDLAIAGAQNTLGGGIDTLINMESLVGSQYDDMLKGDAAANILDGGLGDDTLTGRAGGDVLQGGAGSDTAIYSASTAISINLFTNTASGGEATGDTLTNIENIVAGSGNDYIAGSMADNRFVGGDGIDTLQGRWGNDTLIGGAGNDRLFGGSDDDILNGGTGADMLNGGIGIDTVDYSASSAFNLNFYTSTYAGGEATGDTLTGIENAIGGTGNDYMAGDLAANRFTGGDGIDTLQGRWGNDVLIGQAGNDRLFGGSDDDSLNGGIGGDLLNGGAGNDTAVYTNSTAININLFTNTAGGGEATGDTLTDIENRTGGAGNDYMAGDLAGNKFIGGGGNDTLQGRWGADILDGGTGNDRLFGGADIDMFLFQTGFGQDKIMDFANGTEKADVSGVAGASAASLNVSIGASGNVFASFGGPDTIEFVGITIMADITDADFVF